MAKGYVRFTDVFDYQPLEDSSAQKVQDYIRSTEGKLVQLNIRLKATHSGKITRNNGFYLPHKMKAGVSTWTDQYNKPILAHHNEKADPIGRVIDAAYIDISSGLTDNWRGKTNKITDFERPISDTLLDAFNAGTLSPREIVDIANNYFIQDEAISEDPDYEGLGYIELLANITDADAAQKFADGRYLTGSVGATTNQAVCCVCKQDWASSGKCEHTPGKRYDSKKCVLIAGDLFYDEWSPVNKPADRHSKVIEINVGGIQDFVTIGKESRIPEVNLVMTDTKKNFTDQDLKAIAIKTGEMNGHKHIAHLDEDGDGETSWDDGHSHRVMGFQVMPSKAFEDDEEHTHDLMNPLKKTRDAVKSGEDKNMLFKEAFDRIKAHKFFDGMEGLEDAIKAVLDNKEISDEDKSNGLERLVAATLGKVEDFDKFKPEESDPEVKDENTADTDLADRIEKLEKLLAAKDNMEVSDELQALKDQIASLNAQLEEARTELADSDIKKLKKENQDLKDRLEASRKEARYLHQDIEELSNSLSDAMSSVRSVKMHRVLDMQRLTGDKGATLESIEESLKDKSTEDVDLKLKDLVSKVDIEKIVDTISSGLSNLNPEGTVKDPTIVQDNIVDSKDKDKVELNPQTLFKVRSTYLQLLNSGVPNAQETANRYLEDCKVNKMLPADFSVSDL